MPQPFAEPGKARATFLGASTMLLDDGDTAERTDGFFSRPGLVRTVAGRTTPDPGRIRDGSRATAPWT